MAMKSGVYMVTDNVSRLLRGVQALTEQQVLVGVPESTTTRPPKDDVKQKMTNATLAYIHNYGSPAANIPARPFMEPGIKDARDPISTRMQAAGDAALAGDPGLVRRNLEAAGLEAQNSIRRKITTGPFAPLAPGTVRGRKRRHKSRSNADPRPLIDTGDMRKSISYVVRRKS
jgi:hypothetical protein